MECWSGSYIVVLNAWKVPQKMVMMVASKPGAGGSEGVAADGAGTAGGSGVVGGVGAT